MQIRNKSCIFVKKYQINNEYNYHILYKTNMVREFGEFLPDELKSLPMIKQEIEKVLLHQEPIFD